MKKTMLDVVGQLFDECYQGVDLDTFESHICLNVPLNISIAENIIVVDIETTGLHPSDGSQIVTFGYIKGGSLVILQRTKPGIEFDGEIEEVMRQFDDANGVKIFAFNKMFEFAFLGKYASCTHITFHEIQPQFRVSKDKTIKYAHYGYGEGRQGPYLWAQYLQTKNTDCLKKIVMHNSQCLLKELAIFMVNDDNHRVRVE